MKRKEEQCRECGGKAEVIRGTYQFKESGLNNVVLHGVEIVNCRECGEEQVAIPNMDDLMRTIALALVTKPYGLRGEEIRFLRKYLRMTGEQFSRLLHVDKTTLSKWENNDDKVGSQSDLLIRSYALNLGEGLREKVDQIMRDFDKIDVINKRKPTVEVDAQTNQYQYA
ncbi:MAG TPA: type II TA system antitoxin MqsA family protein [Terriglobales bacterium]|nr:type II TA system antitoxin MqsA family protein [Terriglobales bacterium]